MNLGLSSPLVHVLDELVHALEVDVSILVVKVVAHGVHDVLGVLVVQLTRPDS